MFLVRNFFGSSASPTSATEEGAAAHAGDVGGNDDKSEFVTQPATQNNLQEKFEYFEEANAAATADGSMSAAIDNDTSSMNATEQSELAVDASSSVARDQDDAISEAGAVDTDDASQFGFLSNAQVNQMTVANLQLALQTRGVEFRSSTKKAQLKQLLLSALRKERAHASGAAPATPRQHAAHSPVQAPMASATRHFTRASHTPITTRAQIRTPGSKRLKSPEIASASKRRKSAVKKPRTSPIKHRIIEEPTETSDEEDTHESSAAPQASAHSRRKSYATPAKAANQADDDSEGYASADGSPDVTQAPVAATTSVEMECDAVDSAVASVVVVAPVVASVAVPPATAATGTELVSVAPMDPVKQAITKLSSQLVTAITHEDGPQQLTEKDYNLLLQFLDRVKPPTISAPVSIPMPAPALAAKSGERNKPRLSIEESPRPPPPLSLFAEDLPYSASRSRSSFEGTWAARESYLPNMSFESTPQKTHTPLVDARSKLSHRMPTPFHRITDSERKKRTMEDMIDEAEDDVQSPQVAKRVAVATASGSVARPASVGGYTTGNRFSFTPSLLSQTKMFKAPAPSEEARESLSYIERRRLERQTLGQQSQEQARKILEQLSERKTPLESLKQTPTLRAIEPITQITPKANTKVAFVVPQSPAVTASAPVALPAVSAQAQGLVAAKSVGFSAGPVTTTAAPTPAAAAPVPKAADKDEKLQARHAHFEQLPAVSTPVDSTPVVSTPSPAPVKQPALPAFVQDSEFQFGDPVLVADVEEVEVEDSNIKYVFSPGNLKKRRNSQGLGKSTAAPSKSAAPTEAKPAAKPTAAPAAATTAETAVPSIWTQKLDVVKCPVCMVQNTKGATKCVSCESDLRSFAQSKPDVVAASASSSSSSSSSAGSSSIWNQKVEGIKCPVCMVQNKKDATKCVSCESDLGAASSTKSKPTSAEPTKVDSWGAPAPVAATASIGAGGFSFGAPTAPAAKPVEAPMTATVPSFGTAPSVESAPKSAGFTFGASLAPTTAPAATGGFLFGAATAAPADKPAFSFGSTPAAISNSDEAEASQKKRRPRSNEDDVPAVVSKPAPSVGFTFGAPAPVETKPKEEPKAAAAPFSFDSLTQPLPTKAEQHGTSFSITSINAGFGNKPVGKLPEIPADVIANIKPVAVTTASSAPNSFAGGFSFGSAAAPSVSASASVGSFPATPAFGAPAPTAAPVPVAETKPAAPSAGFAAAPTITSTASFGSFGSSASAAAPSQAFAFGPAAAETKPAQSTSFSFGAPASAPTPAPASSTPLFGGSAPSPAFGASSFTSSTPAPASSGFGNAAPISSAFGPASGFAASTQPTASLGVFGAPAVAPVVAPAAPAMGFGGAPANPFASSMGPSAPAQSGVFGSSQPAGGSMFGGVSAPSASPFGAFSASASAPFSAAPASVPAAAPFLGASTQQLSQPFTFDAAPNAANAARQPFAFGGAPANSMNSAFGGSFGGAAPPAGDGGGFSLGAEDKSQRRRVKVKRPGQ